MGIFKQKPTHKSITCPSCGCSQDVALTAQSVVCKHCNVSIKVGDQKISQYAANVSLETCGALQIDKKGALVVQKRVVAAELSLKGSLKGNTIIYELAHIASTGQMAGDLKARLLQVDDGAILKGYFEIIPANGPALPSAPATPGHKTLAHATA
jgi:hypothetical protein